MNLQQKTLGYYVARIATLTSSKSYEEMWEVLNPEELLARNLCCITGVVFLN